MQRIFHGFTSRSNRHQSSIGYDPSTLVLPLQTSNFTPLMFFPLVEQALRLAAAAHEGQTRKGSDIPYITHPVQVMLLLERFDFNEDQILAAALLHDVVEDTHITEAELRKDFPPEVIDWVKALSEEKKSDTGSQHPWETRKQHHIEQIAAAPFEARAIALADKLHNLETMRYDLRLFADSENLAAQTTAFWNRFNAPLERMQWYYETMIEKCEQSDPRLAPLADACRHALADLETSNGAT